MKRKDYDFAILSVDISDRYPEDIKEICGGRIYGTGFYNLFDESDSVTVHIVDIIPAKYGSGDSDAEYIIDYFSTMFSEGFIELNIKNRDAKSRGRITKHIKVEGAKDYNRALRSARKYISENPEIGYARPGWWTRTTG